MHEAGSIGFRLQMIGAAVFQREATQADAAITGIATAATGATRAVAPLARAQETATQAARRQARETREAAAEVERLRHESEEAAKVVGAAAVGTGAAFATLAGLTIATYATFDEASSKTAAATMATREQQDLLKASAIEQGAASVYSAREAADAQTELAKAGVSVNDILGGGLSGSLALAAAGELAVARAAEIAATTLTVFGLKGDQAGHVADLLAAGAGKAQGSVDDLALGLDYVGVSFNRLNIPLEDTVGTLAMLASNGLLGEKAGTGLRSVISSLTSPVAKASAVMKQYNIDVFDGTGNFIGMAGAAEELKTGLGTLDEETRSAALGAIFGAEAATAAGILYSSGAKGVEEWTNNVDDQGYAAEQAAMKTDNLNGDLERLGGSMDSALIKTGSTANDTMREMVQLLTGLVDWYGALDEGAQGTALGIGMTTAAVLILGGTFMLAVPKILEFRLALTQLNTTARGTAVAGGIVGVALTAAVMVLGALASQSASAAQSAAAFTDTLDEQTGALTKNTRAAIVKQLQEKGVYDFAKKAGISQKELTDAVYEGGDSLKKMTDRFSELNTVTNLWGDTNAFAAGNAQTGLREVSEGLEKSKEAWKNESAATGEAADSAVVTAEAYEAVEESIDGVITSVSDLATELAELNGTNLDARAAARALEAAYDDFDAALEENGRTLDTTTEAGRNNESALDDIAQAALDTGKAIIDSGGSYADYQASLQGSRDQLLLRITDLGVTGQAAQDLADDILAIPTAAEVQVFADTEAAAARLKYIQDLINGIGGTMAVHVANGNGGGGMTQADGAVVTYHANGSVSENHVAQHARAGTMRVWAEPETGGETYVPHALSKRGRSERIMQETAAIFGGTYIPAGGQAFAGGAVVGGTAAAAQGRGDITIIVNPPPGADAARVAALVKVEVQEILRSA